MIRLATICAVVCVMASAGAATTHPATAPYLQAIEIVRRLEEAPGDALLDRDAPLDDRTARFLSQNQKLFDLLHEAAVTDRPEWFEKNGNVDSLLPALNPVRALANVGILRARYLIKQNRWAEAVQTLLDVLTLGRNVGRENQTLVASLVAIGVEEATINELAGVLPRSPADAVRTLSERMKQLPQEIQFSDLMRAEQRYGAAMLSKQVPAPDNAKTLDAMAPFYKAVEEASEETPPLSAADFQRKMTDAVSTIDAQAHPVSRALAQNLVSSFQAFYATWCVHRTHEAMLLAAIQVVRDGPDAIKSSADPFSDGPFELQKKANGFELRSKLVGKDGKAVTMKFGS
jgi:hypothetical protein